VRNPAGMVEVDLRGTRRRRAQLRRYVAQNLLDDGDFLCPTFKECRRSHRPGDVFREGIMSHVGKRFDLKIDGRSARGRPEAVAERTRSSTRRLMTVTACQTAPGSSRCQRRSKHERFPPVES